MNFSRLQKVYKSFKMPVLDVKVGQLLELHEVIGDGDNKRIWKFKCLVIKTWKPSHPDGTFTVRGVSSWVTIEKIYPLSYSKFAKVLLLDEYKHRQSKLYYIRDKVGKAARMKSIISSDRRNLDLMVDMKKAMEDLEKAEAPVVEKAPVQEAPAAAPEAPKTEEVKEEVKTESAPDAEETTK